MTLQAQAAADAAHREPAVGLGVGVTADAGQSSIRDCDSGIDHRWVVEFWMRGWVGDRHRVSIVHSCRTCHPRLDVLPPRRSDHSVMATDAIVGDIGNLVQFGRPLDEESAIDTNQAFVKHRSE